MSNTTVTPNRTGDPTTRRNTLTIRATAVAAGTLAAVAAWALAVPLAGVELAVNRWDGAGTMTVTPALVATVALGASLAGWAALSVLERLTRHAHVVWTLGASIVLLASLAMPMTAAATTAAAVTLTTLHLVVGAVVISTLARSAR